MSSTISYPILRNIHTRNKYAYKRFNSLERIANRKLFYENKQLIKQQYLEELRIKNPLEYASRMCFIKAAHLMALDIYGDGT